MTLSTRLHPPIWRLALWGFAILLWAFPGMAMQFTDEVRWDLADFAVFGLMLVVACVAFELTMRLTTARRARWMAGAAIGAAFLLVWAELAVGIFR